jgi:hypothetical protein
MHHPLLFLTLPTFFPQSPQNIRETKFAFLSILFEALRKKLFQPIGHTPPDVQTSLDFGGLGEIRLGLGL